MHWSVFSWLFQCKIFQHLFWPVLQSRFHVEAALVPGPERENDAAPCSSGSPNTYLECFHFMAALGGYLLLRLQLPIIVFGCLFSLYGRSFPAPEREILRLRLQLKTYAAPFPQHWFRLFSFCDRIKCLWGCFSKEIDAAPPPAPRRYSYFHF
jgi:hypothetical protein